MPRVTPLNILERMLLKGFVDVLNEKPQADENFDMICDFIDGTKKALVAQEGLQKNGFVLGN